MKVTFMTQNMGVTTVIDSKFRSHRSSHKNPRSRDLLSVNNSTQQFCAYYTQIY